MFASPPDVIFLYGGQVRLACSPANSTLSSGKASPGANDRVRALDAHCEIGQSYVGPPSDKFNIVRPHRVDITAP